jgi:altronate dehydratase large subunit
MNDDNLFLGYRRADNRIGVRNYTAVISTVLCSNSVTRKIADATGAHAFTHDGGCGQLGFDRDHTIRVLRGIITHPNIGAALVIGLGCEQIDAESLASSDVGKPVQYLKIHETGGNIQTVKTGISKVSEMMEENSQIQRESGNLDELILATQCGSTDTGSGLVSNPVLGIAADQLIARGGAVILGETGSLYGAAGLLAKRAVSKTVGNQLLEITNVLERYYQRLGKSITEANPTPGNIAGGITTLVEKSLGGIRKGGTTTIQGILESAEQIQGKGLWIMNTSKGIGVCSSTDMLASGAQILAFTTGKGNPIGSPLAPVIKITATRETVETLTDIIDFDASPVLYGVESLEACGTRLFEEIIDVANGKRVQAEKTGHTAFAIGNIIPE